MELSGKAKEKFEEWYVNEFKKSERIISTLCYLYNSPDSMQFGVYVDFFDSVGIQIESMIERSLNGDILYFAERISKYKRGSHLGNLLDVGRAKTRTEARTKAIEKANDLLNKRL